MSLTTLNLVKQHLGIAASDTSEDAFLTQAIAASVMAVRGYLGGQFIGGMIQANSLANPTVITSIGHGLETGDTIVIFNSNSTPSIDGSQTVTYLTNDTFSVPVNVTVAGTSGTYARTLTEFYSGSGTELLLLDQRPVQSISSIYLDSGGWFGDPSGSFASGTLLTSGVDYALKRDNNSRTEKGLSGIVARINGYWPRPSRSRGDLLTADFGDVYGNIKVTYTAGWKTIPPDIIFACNMLIAESRRIATAGGSKQSESFSDVTSYSYTLSTSPGMMDSRQILQRYKPMIVG